MSFVSIGLRVFDLTSEVNKTEQDFCCYNDGSCCFKLEATLPWFPSNHRLTTTTVGRIYRAWTLSWCQRILEFVLPSTMVFLHRHPVDTSASWSCFVLATNVTKTLGLLNNAISVYNNNNNNNNNNNKVHCSFRNMGCLWVLSTSVYQLTRTLVRSSFYPLPWWPIFTSYSWVFLSSCFIEGSIVGPLLRFPHPLFLMCDQST